MKTLLCSSLVLGLLLTGIRGQTAARTLSMPTPSASAAPDLISAAQLYSRSVAAMRILDVPPFVTFATVWDSTGMRFEMYQDDDTIVLALGSGRNFLDRHTYTAAYRQADRRVALTEGSMDRIVGQRSHFLDPTWAGAYDLLRYGSHGGPANGALPTPAPAPVATTSAMPTIGTVSAISAAYYRVEDDGAGSCPSGTSGHLLKLTALADPKSHPLTAVTIDVATNRFCRMRFNLRGSAVVGVTGTYEVEFADNAGYWLVRGGMFDVAVRVLGISAKHVTLHWENSGFAAPSDIATSEFDKPLSTTKR